MWTFIMTLALLLFSMLLASVLKHLIPVLRKSLIPVSVLGGIILLIASTVTYYAAGEYLFNLPIFGGNGEGAYSGMEVLEMITYHCLGIGFIATGMRSSKKKFTKQRAGEIFDSGVTTVNGYLIQAFLGLIITILAVCVFNVDGLIAASGILLAFGFGQGTGQALNYGKIYENEYGFVGGGNFGLTIAALGFLVACIVGVIYINIKRKKGEIKIDYSKKHSELSDYEDENEIPVVSSMDKFTVQIAIVLAVYAASYGLMLGFSALLPDLADTLFGFNFFIGVLLTLPVKAVLNKLYEKKIVKKQVVNNFMMDRIGGFAFDLMIVAGVAAIQIPLLASYWAVLLILAAAGTVSTLVYVNIVCKKIFPSYRHEQFLAFFGMLTGTASTGMILLREIDGSYRSPASENLVYQTVPAMAFGFPLMFLAPYAAESNLAAIITCIIVGVSFAALNIVLFRRNIFRKKYAAVTGAQESVGTVKNDESVKIENPSGGDSGSTDGGTEDGK